MIWILYEEYEGCEANPLGLFNNEEKLKSTIEELAEEALQDILAVDPHDSGIDWDDMTKKEKEDLKQECREMFKYKALIGEYNIIQKEDKTNG